MNPYLEILIRAVGAFAAVIFLARMAGKSQVGGLTISDLANGIVDYVQDITGKLPGKMPQ